MIKIIYAEDNNIDYELVKTSLKEHIVKHVNNGKDLLKEFYQNPYDLVITNLNMPYLNGLEATETIRVLDNTTPIYMISSQIYKKKEAIESGVDIFFDKPLNIKYLKQEVNNLEKRL